MSQSHTHLHCSYHDIQGEHLTDTCVRKTLHIQYVTVHDEGRNNKEKKRVFFKAIHCRPLRHRLEGWGQADVRLISYLKTEGAHIVWGRGGQEERKESCLKREELVGGRKQLAAVDHQIRAHMSSALNSKHACYELDHLDQIHCNMKGMCKPTL